MSHAKFVAEWRDHSDHMGVCKPICCRRDAEIAIGRVVPQAADLEVVSRRGRRNALPIGNGIHGASNNRPVGNCADPARGASGRSATFKSERERFDRRRYTVHPK